MLLALVEAETAPDPVTRFPFQPADPDAIPSTHPDTAHPTGQQIPVADLPPGPELARLLTVIDPDTTCDHTLVELTDAAHRLTSWAHAMTAHLAGLLSTRASMTPDEQRVLGGPGPDQVVGTELALRLSCTRTTATALARRGRAFTGHLAATGAALARGHIDPTRAAAVHHRLADLPVPLALDVQDAVLPTAPGRTPPQVRADLERAILAVDPTEASTRAQTARTRRRVERPTVLPDGMAALRAVLPAVDATRIHHVLDTAARTARHAGDPRTLDQLRADGLTDLVLHDTCTSGPTGDARRAAPEHDDHTRTRGTDRDTGGGDPDARDRAADTPADTGTGDDRDGDDHGDDHGGDGSGGGDGGGSDDGLSTGDLHDTEDAAATPTSAANTGRCRARPRPRTLLRVTVSLPTLLGLDDRPADLDGYGPLDPVTARALTTGSEIQRLVTDPLTGTLLDLGRTRYRPTTALADHIRTRDHTCRRPGCTTPAHTCDLDHTREYHRPPDDGPPGTTSHDNLGALCPSDHRLKTTGGFHLRQTSPGHFEWTTPTGHTYPLHPTDLDPPLPPPAPDDDEPPPF